MITIDKLKKIINWNISNKELLDLRNSLNSVFKMFYINSKLRQDHFLAQILHESGCFKYKYENLNYSARGLYNTFRKYFPTIKDAEQYERKPEKIANKVYGNRYGNFFKGDGYKFRGRGSIQLTFRDNYKLASKYFNEDFISNPDLIAEYPYYILIAGWYWMNRKLNKYADMDDIKAITYRINEGYNGLNDRKKWFELLTKIS